MQESTIAPPNVIGIDADTKRIAVATLFRQDEVPHVKVIEAKGRQALDRFYNLMDEFDSFLREDVWAMSQTVIYVEEPVLRNAKSFFYQSMVVGAVCVMLDYWLEAPCLVHPSVWKKTLLGNGNASKDQVKAWVMKLYPSLGSKRVQDVYDAVAIAHYGRVVTRR